MKLRIVSALSMVCLSVLLFTACKKDDSNSNNNNGDENEVVSAAMTDESQVSNEMDGIALDAATAIEYEPTFSGNYGVLGEIICDATVTYNTTSDPMTITITYDGTTNCNAGRTRSGSIVLAMAKNTHWTTPGSSFTITFNDLKITKTSTNKSITITGTHLVTNVSGGLLIHLATEGPITHTITSNNMKVSFDNGTARTWNVARQRVYTYDNGAVLTITGTHTEGNETGIAEWGTNRLGANFTTSIVTPVVIKQSCNFRVTGGSVIHSTEKFTAVATFGLNVNGEPIDCPGTGSYYYKLIWTGQNGGSMSLILPY